MTRIELQYGATTDIGKVRRVNEDSYLTAPPVFVVADGMGGHSGGDVASAIVVQESERLADRQFDPRSGAQAIAEVLNGSQSRIHEYALGQRNAGAERWYAGTTAVIGLLVADQGQHKWLLANLGDSRIYRFCDGVLEQVSVDHSVVQELIDSGEIAPEEALNHPERHVVTRALGGPDLAEADFFLLPLGSVERLLLCSDGITGMIADAEIERLLRTTGDPNEAAERLVQAALDAGGRDNATAIVVDVVGLPREHVRDLDADSPARMSPQHTLGVRP